MIIFVSCQINHLPKKSFRVAEQVQDENSSGVGLREPTGFHWQTSNSFLSCQAVNTSLARA